MQGYNTNIHVNVTWGQRIEALDWKWISATAVTALLIPGFGRRIESRRPKEGKKNGARWAR